MSIKDLLEITSDVNEYQEVTEDVANSAFDGLRDMTGDDREGLQGAPDDARVAEVGDSSIIIVSSEGITYMEVGSETGDTSEFHLQGTKGLGELVAKHIPASGIEVSMLTELGFTKR